MVLSDLYCKESFFIKAQTKIDNKTLSMIFPLILGIKLEVKI